MPAVSASRHRCRQPIGEFCWLDLAATDASRAKNFYHAMFGWNAVDCAANGGYFTRLSLSGRDVGSLYQLSRTHIDRGVPSHWTPYVSVDNVAGAAENAARFGGHVIVHPFVVSGVAQIAIVLDSTGAQLGLWQPIPSDADTHG
jgi:predicted enzyme related to lactoylglutathione lyase